MAADTRQGCHGEGADDGRGAPWRIRHREAAGTTNGEQSQIGCGVMSDKKISIYFGAPTYQDEPEGRARKAELEREFGLRGEEASIGTGAEGPGIVFLIDIAEVVGKYGLVTWGVLTLGKEIPETVSFYVELAKKLAKYIKGHSAYLEQNGAYALAVNAVVEHLGKTPKSIVLEGYMTGDPMGDESDYMVELSKIGKPPPHSGAFLPHHFQFKIDGKNSVKALRDDGGQGPTARRDVQCPRACPGQLVAAAGPRCRRGPAGA